MARVIIKNISRKSPDSMKRKSILAWNIANTQKRAPSQTVRIISVNKTQSQSNTNSN